MAALAYDSARQRETLREQVQRDGLTGLLNHRACHERLRAGARRAAGRSRSCCIDLDHFKVINDAHGHAEGDRVLAAAAERLRSVVRADDVVGRLGGEEFVLILPGADAEAAEDCAERARAALAELTVRGRPLAASAGVAAAPDDGADAAVLLENARRRAVLGQALGPRPDRALRARRRAPGGRAAQRDRGAARARHGRDPDRLPAGRGARHGPRRRLRGARRASISSRAAGRTSGSRRRTASASARSSRRSRCAPRSPSPAAPRAPSWRSTSRRARCSPRRCRPRCPHDLTGIVDRAHRARGVRRRGRARDRAGRAARPRRAGRARRRRRGLRRPAADHPDRARHPQARPRARPRRARRRLAPGAAGGADRLRRRPPAPRSAPRASRTSTTCARSSRSTSPTRRATASRRPGPPWPAPRPRRPPPARPRSAPACASRSRRAASRARSRSGLAELSDDLAAATTIADLGAADRARRRLLGADDVALMRVDRGRRARAALRHTPTPSGARWPLADFPATRYVLDAPRPGPGRRRRRGGRPRRARRARRARPRRRADRPGRLRRPRRSPCSRSTASAPRPSPPARSTAPACSPSSSARRSTALPKAA